MDKLEEQSDILLYQENLSHMKFPVFRGPRLLVRRRAKNGKLL
jgi:hypothetical protein